MESARRKRLEEAGWSVSSATNFLKLSPEEANSVELKLRLSENLKRRPNKKLSQVAIAKKIKSSRSS